MPHYLHMILFQWKDHNQLRPWETKTVGPGSIFVEWYTPAAFQSHVQTKTGYFPTPALSPPVFRGRKVGQPGLEAAGVCSSHIFLSWILGHATERNCITAQTQPKLIHCSKSTTACAQWNLWRQRLWKGIPGAISSALPLASTGEPVTRMGAKYMLSFSQSTSIIQSFLKYRCSAT